MVILNSKKVIYIHIHKTGGETIEHLLGQFREGNDIMVTSENPGMSEEFDRHFRLRKHSSARQVAKLLGADIWDGYFSWATVRDPYSRLASLYGFAASMSESRLERIGFPSNESHGVQRAWVESAAYPSTVRPWKFAAVRAYLATRAAPSPFSEFLRHPMLLSKEPAYHTQFSQLSYRNSLLVKRVVKLESLSAEWPELCRQMDIPPTELTVRNATPAKWRHNAKELLRTPADLQLVNRVYAEDFRRFGYETIGRDPVPRIVAAPNPEAT